MSVCQNFQVYGSETKCTTDFDKFKQVWNYSIELVVPCLQVPGTASRQGAPGSVSGSGLRKPRRPRTQHDLRGPELDSQDAAGIVKEV